MTTLREAALLAVEKLSVVFPVQQHWWRPPAQLRAVESMSLTLSPGEALGIVGESGCGKSTLARAILQLVKPSAGQVVWLGKRIDDLPEAVLRPVRKDLQIVFQDPLASLNPRMTVGEIVAEPLRVHRPELDRKGRLTEVTATLDRVGLNADHINRYPHEFSGGQCQRIGIARAMVLKPQLLVCDEPVSALDVSIQAQIINLLKDLQRDSGMSILFVSHNLAVVRRLCHRVAVLYLGRLMEIAPTDALFRAPRHPYTRGLLDAIPLPDPCLQPQRLGTSLGGELPSPLAPPSGCVFRTRCPRAEASCAAAVPSLDYVDGDTATHAVACRRWREL
jgi:oligopeptide transport system ATP-binding protein